jgi:hypothetical protein
LQRLLPALDSLTDEVDGRAEAADGSESGWRDLREEHLAVVNDRTNKDGVPEMYRPKGRPASRHRSASSARSRGAPVLQSLAINSSTFFGISWIIRAWR